MVGNPVKVALLIPRGNAFDRGILRGIARYRNEGHDWQLFNYRRRLDQLPASLEAYADGIIAHIQGPDARLALKQLSIPLVHCTAERTDAAAACVCADDRAIGKMAAEYLLERGFEHFAYEGFSDHVGSDIRYEGFSQTLYEAGIAAPIPRFFIASEPLTGFDQASRWLDSLDRPVGIFTFNDNRAERLQEVIRHRHLRVPRDVAVLGVNNDPAICELTPTHLSSIDPDAQRIGYEAAALLDKLINAAPTPERPLTIPPLMVHARASTSLVMVNDAEVARAIEFIESAACQGISVEDVVEKMMISRSSLERRFRRATGHSVYDEIRHVRLQQVLRLLGQTDLPLAHIAARTGFRHISQLCDTVKAQTGRTPGQFRRFAQPG